MHPELRQLARQALQCAEVNAKLAGVAELESALQQGVAIDAGHQFEQLPAPGRPETPRLVLPKALPKRGLATEEGRAALLHAVAHIEFNAINLACDAIQRFPGMPGEYYRDWASVAVDEARHFRLVQHRLASMGHAYGDFDAHDGLWEMAEKTQHSCRERMALVPRLLEARGLDVTPGMIVRLRQAGDTGSVAVLEVILHEEVRHVAIGSHWFLHCCQLEGLDPEQEFLRLLRMVGPGSLRGPFNHAARLASGFSSNEMEMLSALARS